MTQTPNKRTTLPILRWQLRSGLRGLIGWSIGLALALLLYLPVYPSVQSPQLSDMINSLPKQMSGTLGLDRIATGAGYTQATYFGLLGFLLAAMACIIWGSQAIAGAEDSGQLELTLSHAVSRGQYALESFVTLVVRILALSATTVVVLLLLNSPSELSLTAGNIVTATVAWSGLALVAGSTALAVGSMTGRPNWSIGAGAAITVAGYAFDAVSKSSSSLRWLSNISPYSWAFGDDPLSTGRGWGGIALLGGLSIVLFGLGYWVFCRRDLHG
ncbi:MAG: ABC transporter permease subunit [Propionibacteriaceae bacterium]|nr:ABC transporter permease subunit [Propionibacteriaceae bacterium]